MLYVGERKSEHRPGVRDVDGHKPARGRARGRGRGRARGRAHAKDSESKPGSVHLNLVASA